jgi:hypothetical protein
MKNIQNKLTLTGRRHQRFSRHKSRTSRCSKLCPLSNRRVPHEPRRSFLMPRKPLGVDYRSRVISQALPYFQLT